MKFLVELLAFLPMLWAAEFQKSAEGNPRSLSGQVVNTIEDMREQMPCGFPNYGIPPLAPYKGDHQEIRIDTNTTKAFGEVNNFRLYGLNDFDIVELRIIPVFGRGIFKFNWNNVSFTTNYKMSIRRGRKKIKRSGPAKFALKNLIVWGVIKYNVGLLNGKLSVKELSIYVSLGEVKSEIGGLSHISIVNKKLNRIIEKWVMTTVNENTNKVAELSNKFGVPFLNNALGDMSLAELLNMIGVGSGEGNEKEPCIPPEDLN